MESTGKGWDRVVSAATAIKASLHESLIKLVNIWDSRCSMIDRSAVPVIALTMLSLQVCAAKSS